MDTLNENVLDLPLDEALLALVRARIADRIRLAMRRRNFPASPAEAYGQLATALGWDISAIVHLVSGNASPSLEQLVALSRELAEPLSFFTDEREEPLPTGTVVVEPVDSGEPLVIRLPSEQLAPRIAGQGLVYFYALRAMGFGVEAGCYVVATRGFPDGLPYAGRLYLFDEDGRIELRICADTTSGRSVFKGEDGSSMIWPAVDRIDAFTHGEVVALLRCGQTVHHGAEQAAAHKKEGPTS
jgi:transcriptional regulator with XRE-family HTH domain